MMRSLLYAGGARAAIGAAGISLVPPPPPEKRTRRRAVTDAGDGNMLMTLSAIGRQFKLKHDAAINLAARRGWALEFDGVKAVFRVPQDYLVRRTQTKAWGRHSKRSPNARHDLFTPTA